MGMDVAKVTIVRSSSGQTVAADSTANVVAPVLNLFPATVSGVPNQTLNANGVAVATLIDSDTTSKATDFSATIQWGAGLPTTTATVTPVLGTGAAANTAVPGLYTVNGTFIYPAPGVYHPVVTVVRTTLGQTVSTTSTAFIAAPTLVFTGSSIPFTGGVDPLSFPRLVRGIVVTNQQEPILTGTAKPGATVSLSLRRLGLGDPITLGETMADPSGRWSLVVGPLGGPPFLLYGVATPVDGPPSPITPLNGGLPILVTNRSLHVTVKLARRHGDHAHHRGRLG